MYIKESLRSIRMFPDKYSSHLKGSLQIRLVGHSMNQRMNSLTNLNKITTKLLFIKMINTIIIMDRKEIIGYQVNDLRDG